MRRSFIDVDSEDDSDRENVSVPLDPYCLVVIGARKSGKSSLIRRLHKNTFSLAYQPTLCMQAHHDIQLGDVNADIWEIPCDASNMYSTFNLEPHGIVLIFNSDVESSYQEGITIWKRLRNRLYTRTNPQMWIVNRGRMPVTVDTCHPNRFFTIDSMASTGLDDFVFDIRTTLLLST